MTIVRAREADQLPAGCLHGPLACTGFLMRSLRGAAFQDRLPILVQKPLEVRTSAEGIPERIKLENRHGEQAGVR